MIIRLAMEYMIPFLIVLAYLIGAIPTSVWVGKIFFKLDIREHGSGNAGATNTVRVLGWKAGVPVMIFDVFKGWLAVSLADFFNLSLTPDGLLYFKISLAAVAVLGHVYPVYAGFRGGKGVAALLGAGIALFPYAAWIALGIFIVVLLFTGYVSVASLTAAITFPFVEILVFGQDHPGLMILSIAVALFIPFTHRSNIKRLLKGEENKFIRKKTRK